MWCPTAPCLRHGLLRLSCHLCSWPPRSVLDKSKEDIWQAGPVYDAVFDANGHQVWCSSSSKLRLYPGPSSRLHILCIRMYILFSIPLCANTYRHYLVFGFVLAFWRLPPLRCLFNQTYAQTLNQSYANLRPGGRLVVCVPLAVSIVRFGICCLWQVFVFVALYFCHVLPVLPTD